MGQNLRRIIRWTMVSLLLVFILPVALHAAVWSFHGWPRSWRDADWSSAGLLPDPRTEKQAMIRVYSARTGAWKGIFATHSWIVLKPKGATAYERFDVVGWGNPVRRNAWAPDGRWYGNRPEVVRAIDGPQAEQLIPRIEAAIALYRWSHAGDYTIWPGPNSNTFVAGIAAAVPDLAVSLPSTAIGRDFPIDGQWIGHTPGGGWRLSLGGYAGVAVGPVEGIEINFLGLVAGLDFMQPAVKIPGFGRVGLPATF
jgi:hypothetical protein